MAQNVTIAGASYSGVPEIDVPKTGGGMAKFTDTSDANATANDILAGKTAYVSGTKIAGALALQWGMIGGTLSNQTDLITALNAKEPKLSDSSLGHLEYTVVSTW